MTGTSGDSITRASLRVARDIGHGGAFSEYRVEPAGGGYEVTRSTSRLTPRPGESRFEPSQTRETLAKESWQVEEFLGRLSGEFKVCELADLKWPYPFLHPTFYSFGFRTADGRAHAFNYEVEGIRHLDARYEGLVAAFEEFFGR